MLDNYEEISVFIPARKGSKRLPRKNMLKLDGKPLVEWTINSALQCFQKKNIIVSTDDEEIIDLCREKELYSVSKRPYYLAQDNTTTRDVILYELDRINKKGGQILILQPTSPLRSGKQIREAIDIFKQKKALGVVSVCECDHPPEWSNFLPSNNSMKDFLSVGQNTRSQEFDKSYRLNGAIYLYDSFNYIINANLINHQRTYAYIMDKMSSIDIDDQFDFDIAQYFLSKEND